MYNNSIFFINLWAMSDTAIVILNWNGEKFLKRYLKPLCASCENLNSFVVVADNASTDGSVEWLKENFPQVKLLEFDQNYGFTGGYNRALKQIEADYYVIINSDLLVTDNWLSPLLAFMDENPDVAACQPKILSESNREFFEYAGACGGFIDKFGYPFCRGRILSNIEKDSGQYDDPEQIFWASGACMVVRSSVFHHLGGFDDAFFAHMEEIDLCWRIKLLGYQIWAIPSSVVYHVGGGTLPNDSPFKLYLNYRNNLLMLYKNLPHSVRWSRIFIRKTLDLASAMVYLVSGKLDSFKAVMKAHKDYSKMKHDLETSSFDREQNKIGFYKGSIVLRFFLSGKKLIFSKLKF